MPTRPQIIRRIAPDVSSKMVLLSVALVIPGFIFDRRISSIMYALGYDPGKISNLWFLRDQYGFLKENKLTANLTGDPFHVFELIIWIAVATTALRLLIELPRQNVAKDAGLKPKELKVSALKLYIGWLMIGPLSILLSTLGIRITTYTPSAQHLLSFSPTTFVCLEALVFWNSTTTGVVEGAFFIRRDIYRRNVGAAPNQG